MKKLPRRIEILGQRWKINYVPNLRADVNSDEDSDEDDNEKVSGLSDGTNRIISVCTSTNKTPDQVQATLLHEIIHSIIFVSGQRNLFNSQQEEALVVALEHGLAPLVTLK